MGWGEIIYFPASLLDGILRRKQIHFCHLEVVPDLDGNTAERTPGAHQRSGQAFDRFLRRNKPRPRLIHRSRGGFFARQ
jgi:hypothetical protein